MAILMYVQYRCIVLKHPAFCPGANLSTPLSTLQVFTFSIIFKALAPYFVKPYALQVPVVCGVGEASGMSNPCTTTVWFRLAKNIKYSTVLGAVAFPPWLLMP